MSLLYDEGQQAIATESRRVLDARSDKSRLLALIEQNGEIDDAWWATAREQGWTALAVPEESGGLGLGLVELGLVAQAAGATTSGAPFLTSGYGVTRALIAAGESDTAAHWLGALASGDAIAAVAFAENQSPLPQRPLVRYSNGKLSGTKHGVVGGAKADIALVLALGSDGPCLVLAELAAMTPPAIASYDPTRCSADLVFVDTPATLLLSGPGVPAAALDIMAAMAVVTAHEQGGGAEALMGIARDYALTRKAFGQPIGAFQSIKHRIAELYGLIEIARANAIDAASKDGTPAFFRAAAAARLSATEAYDTAARDCVQIHGGIGVTWETGLHLHMRRARSLAVEQGNMLWWEDRLVTELDGGLE